MENNINTQQLYSFIFRSAIRFSDKITGVDSKSKQRFFAK